jgi:peptidoglycan/LPS O-acetylase OafA/YrhL
MGFKFLSSISTGAKDAQIFWNGIGAALIIWTTSNCLPLLRFFSGPVAGFLGKVSFALYLVHGIVIHVLGVRLLPLMWKLTGTGSSIQWELGFFLAIVVYLPVCLFIAKYFTVFIDEPSLRFSRWLEDALGESTSEKPTISWKDISFMLLAPFRKGYTRISSHQDSV